MTGSEPGSRVERLVESILERFRQGERPSLSEYERDYPDLAGQIRELLPALLLMEKFASAAGPSATGPVPIPQVLGEYRILREVGHGGMGVVYEAVQEPLGRHVALKVLPFHGTVHPMQRERFRREAQAAARLHHTNIVPVFGVGEHAGICYYAMQFIESQGLDAVIRELREGSVPIEQGPTQSVRPSAAARSLWSGDFEVRGQEQATPVPGAAGGEAPIAVFAVGAAGSSKIDYFRGVARLGVQVADALAYAHQQGIVHRDIKPSNLLLDARGTVWVTDFGLAKAEGADELTGPGDIVGTLRYMAPERFRGEAGPPSDVYSLGATLYELATLRPVFEDVNRARLMQRIQQEDPPRPRRLDPAAPRDLETVIVKAMAKEPGARYLNAEALADDLRLFLADRPVQARRSGAAEQLWRWCRRNPLVASLLASVAALLIVVALGSLLSAAWLREERDATRASEWRTEEARREASAALSRSETNLYTNRIALANREWWGNNVAGAEGLLDLCPPRLCDWEWRYLKRLCHLERLNLGHGHAALSAVFSPDQQRMLSVDLKGTICRWDAGTGDEIDTWPRPEAAVNHAAFSADGQWLAWTDGGKSVTLLEPNTGRRVRTFPGHQLDVVWLVFSPDGQRLASLGRRAFDAEVKIWDPATGALISTLDGPTQALSQVTFSPDGLQMASIAWDGVVQLWDVASGKQVRVLGKLKDGGESLTFERSGQRLVAGDAEGKLWLLDVKTGNLVRVLRGHTDRVRALAFTADGKRLASAGDDQTVRVWTTGSESSLVLRGHKGAVRSVAFRGDGQQVVSTGLDGSVKVWDLLASQPSRSLEGHAKAIEGIAFHPEGRQFTSASRDGIVKTWDAATGQALNTFDTGAVIHHVTYSPDGRQLATASGLEVKLWETATGKALRTFAGHAKEVRAVAFSPDGRHLVSADRDETVRIWNVDGGKEIHSFRGSTDVAVSPDGKHLACAGEDHSVEIRTMAEGRLVHVLRGHSGSVSRLAYSHDGRWLASAGASTDSLSGPGELKIWDAATGRELLNLRGHSKTVLGLAFSPHDRRLASAGEDRAVKIWDTHTGHEILTLQGHAEVAHCLAFSPDGLRLLTGHRDNSVGVWDAPINLEPRARQVHAGSAASVAVSSRPGWVASGGWDNTVRIWNTEFGEEGRTLRGHEAPVLGVSFSPDGRQLASASADQTVKVWDVAGGQVVRTISGHTDRVSCVAWSPDGRLATGSADKTIRIWESSTGQLLRTLPEQPHAVTSVAWSADGCWLAAAGHGPEVKVWNAATGAEVRILQGHAAAVADVAFSPDGTFLATASRDQTVKIWSTADGSKRHTLRENTEVRAVAYSPNGRLLASAGNGRAVMIWDPVAGKKLFSLPGQNCPIFSLAFSADGSELFAAAEDGTIKSWNLAPWLKHR